METLANLTQLNKVPLDMTLEGLGAVQQGRRADDIGLQELTRKQAHEIQMDPMRVAHQQLVNRGLTLGNDEAGFRLAAMGRKDRMETELWDQTKATQLQKLLASEGDDKAKIFENGIYEQLRSTKPGTPQHRALTGALETTRGWMEDRRKQQFELQKQNNLFAQQTKLEEMRNASKLAIAQLRQSASASLAAAKTPKDYQNLGATLTQRLYAEKDPDIRAELEQQLTYVNRMMLLANAGNAKPVVDPSRVPQAPLTTPNAAPLPSPTGSSGNKTKSGISYQVVP